MNLKIFAWIASVVCIKLVKSPTEVTTQHRQDSRGSYILGVDIHVTSDGAIPKRACRMASVVYRNPPLPAAPCLLLHGPGEMKAFLVH